MFRNEIGHEVAIFAGSNREHEVEHSFKIDGRSTFSLRLATCRNAEMMGFQSDTEFHF
jgi:hypothetical protein